MSCVSAAPVRSNTRRQLPHDDTARLVADYAFSHAAGLEACRAAAAAAAQLAPLVPIPPVLARVPVIAAPAAPVVVAAAVVAAAQIAAHLQARPDLAVAVLSSLKIAEAWTAESERWANQPLAMVARDHDAECSSTSRASRITR